MELSLEVLLHLEENTGLSVTSTLSHYLHVCHCLFVLNTQGGAQFCVRSAADENIVDTFCQDFLLSPGETLTNQTLYGNHFGKQVTFNLNLSLTCTFDSFGPQCDVYCQPADDPELGHYSCLSNGSIECLDGYRNEAANCTECIPAPGCSKSLAIHIYTVIFLLIT